MTCPFCKIPEYRIIEESNNWVMVRDQFPVSRGHTLVIYKHHVRDWFDISCTDQQEALHLINQAKVSIQQEYEPDGFNIGINCGRAAGQTVDHCHIHIIPRYNGDVEDPRGGVRGVIPNKQKY